MSSWLIFRPRYLNSTIDQQYELVFLGTQGVTPWFFSSRGLITSVRSLAATSVPLVRATHRPPPSATAPHRLPGTWLLCILPATTRIVLAKDVFAPTSILGRHSSAAGSPFRCGSETRTHSRKRDPLPVSPGTVALENQSLFVHRLARWRPARASAARSESSLGFPPSPQQAHPIGRCGSFPLNAHLASAQ